MINGFEKETKPLTENELDKVVPAVVEILKTKRGSVSAIKNFEISDLLFKDNNLVCVGERIRAVIHYIRVNHLIKCLVASSKGYFIEPDIKKLKDYENSLWGREASIQNVRLALHQNIKEVENQAGGCKFSDIKTSNNKFYREYQETIFS